jgi:CubicO group peptidase (beta-lactamase class C family)
MLNKKTLFILLLISIPALSCRFMASAFTSTQEPGAHSLASKTVDPITQSPKTSPNRGKAVYDWSVLDRALESFVPDEVDGLTFILSKDGQILYEKALGNQTMDSFLPIASSTKMPSAVVILSLAQEGLLDLDEPISTYLQGHINWPSDKSAITTRMMLNHTSGLPSNPFCLNRKRGTLKECAQEIANAPLEFAPGTQFAYGGGSFQVAGYVAEAVSGKSWNDLFHERLATPLGLEKFTYSGGTLGSETNPRIAGGASSTAYDYIKILQMILSNRNYNPGVFILSPEIIRMMSTSQIKGLPILRSPGEDYLLLGYSFGFWISDPSIHPGSNGPELSDPGAFGCTPWVDFDLGYAAVLLIKASTRKGADIWNTIRPSIIAELKAAK